MKAADLIAFLEREARAMRVEITRVRGSSPREEGAVMVVSPMATGSYTHLTTAPSDAE